MKAAKDLIGHMPLRIGGPHISFDSLTGQRAMPNDERKSRPSSVLDLNKGNVKLALSARRWTLSGLWPDIPSNPKQMRVVRSCGGDAPCADIPYDAEPSSRGDCELIP
jgi:hypothetical protein